MDGSDSFFRGDAAEGGEARLRRPQRTPSSPAIALDRWRPLRSRGLAVDFPFFSAPMVGLSNLALRSVLRRYRPAGVGSLTFTEMLSSRRLPTERLGERPETSFDPDEGDLVPQVAGSERRFLEASIGKLAAMRPAALDVNMGCPVAHAFRRDWGVALMADPKRAEEVVRTCARRAPWPVSAKVRTGLRDDPEALVDFARMLEGAGAAWITVHPRTAGDKRRGRARWDYIARVREAVSIPVVGNGDIQTAADALELLRRTGCDGVMIGRASLGRPWIFWQIAEALGLPAPAGRAEGSAPRDGFAEAAEARAAILSFLDEAGGRFGPEDAFGRVRYFLGWAALWFPFGHELMRRVGRAGELAVARLEIERFFSRPQRMSERSALLR
jgi:nifR3 family TIM-barrel protein